MKAHELLSAPDKWCKGANAQSESGASVNDSSPGACRWCLYGAMRKCYPVLATRWPFMEKLIRGIHTMPVVAWNDAPERTWTEVHDLLVKLDI